ncbi:MAG: dTDP-4-dehydrorhamnose 3,5-epimerase family protein [Geminicoccaceae bacterium]
MHLISRPLPGMLVLQTEPRTDERGFFTRCFCRHELAALGIASGVEQANLSFSGRAGTLRGLHYQMAPSAETKVLTCVQGAAHDVVLDVRPNSPTYGRHASVELSAANARLVVVPEGCAHGFLTLRDDTLLLYLVSAAYDPVRERAVRWNDPAFAISWPAEPTVLSPRDAAVPDYDPGHHLAA